MIQLAQLISQSAAQGMDYKPFEAMLTETLNRFDDRLDVKDFMPNVEALQTQAQQTQQAQVMPQNNP